MKPKTCPKCGSADIIPDMLLHGSESIPPYVDIVEPEPANRPFVWIPKNAQSQFRAHICGACGYTEFYAVNFSELNEMHKKGFKPK